MYKALYRKWRSATFSDIIGQQNIVSALKNQLLHNKIGHAYIFTGTRGTGKTTCAKIFAKAVNCLNLQDGNPCLECSLCKGIESGAILDVMEIDAASNNGVDNIRDMRDETAYTPGAGKYKVYIIDEVHMLSQAAFNALLKIMEEPPPHVIFILATTEIHKVPATILSRCQRFDFSRIGVDDIAQHLLYVAKEENIILSDTAAGLIARLADGAMRDALSILDTCRTVSSEVDEETVRKMAGVTDKNYLFDLSDCIYNKDIASAMQIIAQLRENSVDMKRLCDELILHYRNLMLASIKSQQSLLSAVSREEEIKYYDIAIKILSGALEKMSKSSDLRITLETAVFLICDAENELINEPNSKPNTNLNSDNSKNTNTTVIKTITKQQAQNNLSEYENQSTDNALNSEDNYVDEFEKRDYSNNDDEQIYTTSQSNEFTAQNENYTQQVINAKQTSNHAASQSNDIKPPPKEKMQIFENWQEVIEKMQSKDKLLYANLQNSKAYFDGTRIRIDGSDLFLEYMRKNDYSKELIRDTIKEVCGTNYPIGPYHVAQTKVKQYTNLNDTLKNLEQNNVPVVYSDNKK